MSEYTTPLDREILSHYYCCSAQFRDNQPATGASAVIEAHEKFRKLGLLEWEVVDGVHCYKANRAALEIYMDALASIPLPVNRWVMP